MGGNIGKTLKGIDTAQAGDKKVAATIDKIFKEYDKDRSGTIDGPEYAKFIKDVAAYVKAGVSDQYTEAQVEDGVKNFCDPDKNGRITLAELHHGLKPLLDWDEK
eukprot:TRINITY_DN68_c0_g1_i1.p3 TRINITY_DN68_c0_g1~~TRINITY_DN68_c0_g1_i1.p3  ORF type:complete len:105 (-),score=34.79 TRINITY_DN68_c0_g1_i1:190-504(-)